MEISDDVLLKMSIIMLDVLVLHVIVFSIQMVLV